MVDVAAEAPKITPQQAKDLVHTTINDALAKIQPSEPKISTPPDVQRANAAAVKTGVNDVVDTHLNRVGISPKTPTPQVK
jgi:hypothetical protein